MRFILRGEELELSSEDVEDVARGCGPEAIRKHYVEVDGKRFPLKQMLEEVLKVKGYKGNEFNRLDFTTIDARSILKRLGFRCGEV
jgi:hypothetical protein